MDLSTIIGKQSKRNVTEILTRIVQTLMEAQYNSSAQMPWRYIGTNMEKTFSVLCNRFAF
jgi:hypothetical protein